MLDRQPTLVGPLLELRPLRADDWGALFAAASDPLIWEQHPERDRYTEEVFRRFFAEALASGGALVAIERTSGLVVGSSRFHGYDADRRVVEIGWSFLVRRCWGGRYNGEMKRLMLEHAFGAVDRVRFVIGPENRRSRRAVEKIGAVLSGATRDAQGRERVLYELTKARYASASPQTGLAPRSDDERNDSLRLRDHLLASRPASPLARLQRRHQARALPSTDSTPPLLPSDGEEAAS
jgi:RimJ/RimL family protein N-acetyltransferase